MARFENEIFSRIRGGINMSEETNKIGDKGENLNLSHATRAVHITPDLERLAKYDEYPAKVRKQKLKNLAWFLIFAVPTAKLISMGYVWWSIIPGILSLWNLFWFIAHKNASPQAVYEKGLLCGAIIVNENPLQIAVMSEMQTSEDDPTCWGIKCFDVKELPLHKISKGERVPCSVMFGGAMPFSGLWGEMEPHPVCWATADVPVLEKAKQAIDENEWRTLETLAELAIEREDVDFTKKIAYFNEDLSPRIDLQEKPEKQQKGEAVTANPNNFLMVEILWSFTDGKRATQDKFVQELVEYNLEIAKREINPDKIVIESREIIVAYAFVGEDDEDKDCEFRLTADSEKGFTMGELLYKIHNQVVADLEELDYHFFEGLVENGEQENIPLYYLNLGS